MHTRHRKLHSAVYSAECTLLYRPGATNYLVLVGQIQTGLEETVGHLQGRGRWGIGGWHGTGGYAEDLSSVLL